MADVKISELTAQASASVDVSADVLAVVDTSATQTKKISVENLLSPITIDKSAGTITSLGTVTGNLDMQDNNKILLGTGDDLEIYFDGTASHIHHTPGSGQLFISSDQISFDDSQSTYGSGGGGNNYFMCYQGSGVVFNEEGQDHDFRVETTGNTHGFHIDAGNNVVNINRPIRDNTANTPDEVLALKTFYPDASSDGNAGAGGLLSFYIPDDETNPALGGGVACLRESGDDSNMNSCISIYTSGNDTSITEKARFDSNGFFGVGATPTCLLHLESDEIDPTLKIINKTTAAINTGADIEFWNNPFTGSTTNAYESGAIRVRKNNGSDNNHDHYMAFEVRKNSPEGINEVMRLKHGGQVGIGTSTNVGNLSVNSGISSSSSSNVITIHQVTDGNDKPVVGFGTAIGNGGESTNAGDLIISTASGGSLGERVRIKSDGALTLLEKASAISNSLRFQATETVGDDEAQNYTMDGTCCIVIVANHSSDDAALFFMSYTSATITKIADPSNEYDTSATDGKSCIYKSSNSATFTIENKRGGARNMGVAQIAVTSTV